MHFGLGPELYPEAYYIVHDIHLPIRWMSPDTITSANFSTASDVWAFGVVVWELFSYGDLPFKDMSNEEVISYVVLEFGKLTKPVCCSNEIFQIAKSCWAIEAQVRPNFASLHNQIFKMMRQSGSHLGAHPFP